MRQADVFDNRPCIAEHLAAFKPQGLQSVRHTIYSVLLWDTYGFSANISCQRSFEIGHRQVH